MLQGQGRFAIHVREQVWLLTCCCSFPFFYTSFVKRAVLIFCLVSWKKKSYSTACGKMLYLLCLELISYFWVPGGWKTGSLMSMLPRGRMWHPSSGVWDVRGWSLGDVRLGLKIDSCFWVWSSKISHRRYDRPPKRIPPASSSSLRPNLKVQDSCLFLKFHLFSFLDTKIFLWEVLAKARLCSSCHDQPRCSPCPKSRFVSSASHKSVQKMESKKLSASTTWIGNMERMVSLCVCSTCILNNSHPCPC